MRELCELAERACELVVGQPTRVLFRASSVRVRAVGVDVGVGVGGDAPWQIKLDVGEVGLECARAPRSLVLLVLLA